MRESKVTVKIPRPLYRKIQQVVDGSGFNSPTDFIVYVLRDLMGETQAAEERPGAHEYSPEELDDVKRKLKNLGYL
jgi:Arc/MetJ-type ribon-helix-helix transcriptional regulator